MKKTLGAMLALTAILAMTLGWAKADVYLGGGTAVYKEQGQAPAADDGALVCTTNGVAIGGGCLPFGTSGYVEVNDLKNAHNIAFQVCIDNNGDGVCTSPDKSPVCADIVVFSHGDDGTFHNPLGPLPSSFTPGCGNGTPWKGYVVFLCNGVHATRSSDGTPTGGTPSGHTHETTIGTISNAPPSPFTGFGNFCGGVVETPSRKHYLVQTLPL